jgi:superfamily I DNA and/or RNA helicase
MLTDSEKKLILLSYTNRSVDEICSRLTEQQITFIRFGNQSHLNQEEKSQSLPFSEISRCRIFVSTLSSFSAISADVMQHLKLDELIVDEASQITEHSIIGLMSSLPKTILVGDQNQLPPVILHQTDETHLSIFEKLSHYAEQNTGFSLLTTHYRMHESVAGLVNTAYGNKLQAGSDRQKTLDMWLKPSDAYLQILLEHRIIWIDTLSTGQSKVDQMQAEWIGNFLEKLLPFLPEGRAADCVGIISPFRAQVQCIRNRLSQQTHSFTIDTVERYQGSERDCIIVSYPLRYAYELGMIQSLSQDGCLDRKLNVALSRAREQIIILGNSQVLTQSIHFKLVYEYIKEHGSVVNL